MADQGTLYCSFCGKSQHEVLKLIAGPTCFICDECVDLCSGIIADERAKVSAIQHPALRARWSEKRDTEE